MSGESAATPSLPDGAMVVVVSQSPAGPRYLLVHDAEDGRDPDEEGDWAWISPGGSREPGEAIEVCAARELYEETGVRAEPQPVATEDIGWAIFYVEVPWGTDVRLSEEHNNFAWVTYEEACRRILPPSVAHSFRTAVQVASQA